MNITFNISSIEDCGLRQALQQKIDNLNKPKGSLGRLELLAMQMGLIQQNLSVNLEHPCHILFGADHGIEHEGVSVSPRDVTWQQMINFTHGGGGVNVFSKQHGFDLTIVDMGVDHDLSDYKDIVNKKIRANGTGNFLHEPAMTTKEMYKAMEIGAELVSEKHHSGCNVISFGEMGIGNTSPSSIWMHLFTGIPLDTCVGAGAGLNAIGIQHKYDVLSKAISNYKGSTSNAYQIIAYFGGFEMVAAIGAMLKAAEQRMIIIVDGFIMTACMLAAAQLHPNVKEYAIFAHSGDEAGHDLMLKAMNVTPLLRLGLRLGEGTGALIAYPILKSAETMLNNMGSFTSSNITKYF